MAGRDLNPTVEDYTSDSDDSDGVQLDETVQRRASPSQGQANVAAKRSNPSDLGADSKSAAEKVTNIDLQSDSGYSSHTAATIASADSAPRAPSRSPQGPPPPAVHMPPPSPAMKMNRPPIGEKSSSHSSPRKPPLQRTGSVSSRNRPPRERSSTITQEECTDPNCSQCGPGFSNPSRGRRPKPSPLDSGLDIPYPPVDQRSQRSDPPPASSYVSPQSPIYPRQPDPYMRGPAILQPAQSSRRRSSSTARGNRPQSYHGGDASGYWPGMPVQPVQPSYPSPPQERGPPPARSAYHPMQQPQGPQGPYAMMGATPPNNFYPPMGALQTPPYDGGRPPMPSRNSSGFNARRPNSGYGPALITQEPSTAKMPSARYPSNVPQSAGPRQDRFYDEDSSSSEYDYSDEEEVDNDRALMPPPKFKGPLNTRPKLPRPKTIQDYPAERDRRMSQSLTLERPQERVRDPRASRLSTAAPSRTNSVSRPKLVQQPKAQSAFETSRNAQVMVESSKNRRRQSYQAYDKQFEKQYDSIARKHESQAKRRSQVYQDDELAYSGDRRSRAYPDEGFALPTRRQSKVYHDEEFVDPQPQPRRNTKVSRDEDMPAPQQRRRQTESAGRPRRDTKLKSTTDDIEAYLQQTRGSKTPLNDQVHRAAKVASRVPSGPSDSGSSRSDKGSRVSHSNRTTVTSSGGGEIRLRVDASAPLSLQFNGDMEGRTLHFKPAEDGMADIVIADGRGNENTYQTQSQTQSQRGSRQGSVLGSSRKTVLGANQARQQDYEEAPSVRSSRSNQSRREKDGERRVLRRRGDSVCN